MGNTKISRPPVNNAKVNTSSIDKYPSKTRLSITSWIQLFCIFSLFAFLFFLLGLPSGFSLLGFSTFYAKIITYNIAATISYYLVFDFYPELRVTDVMKRKVAIISFLSISIISSLLTYRAFLILSIYFDVASIPNTVLPIIFSLINIFVCKVGNCYYRHESNYIPLLLSLLLPLAGIMPLFMNSNISLYISFILSYGIVKIIRQPILKFLDNDLREMKKFYSSCKAKVKNEITSSSREEIETYLSNDIAKNNYLSGVSNKDDIKYFIQLAIDKAIIRLMVATFGQEAVKQVLLQGDRYRNNKVRNLYLKLSDNFRSWVELDSVRNKIRNGPKESFFQIIRDFDLASTRSYYLKQNSSQNSMELSYALIVLILGSTINVFFPISLISENYLVTITLLTIIASCVNMSLVYASQYWAGYSLVEDDNIEDSSAIMRKDVEVKSIFGLRYEHKSMKNDEMYASLSFNIYFFTIILLSLVFLMKSQLMSMYSLRLDHFIPWAVFWPQILICSSTVIFTLSAFSSNYYINLNTRIIVFAILLYSGIILNIFCPQLLFLFTLSPNIVNYVFMAAFSTLTTHLMILVGYDEPVSREGYTSGVGSPCQFNYSSKNDSFDNTVSHNFGSYTPTPLLGPRKKNTRSKSLGSEPSGLKPLIDSCSR
ncbi:MAG: hypothetical protein VX335_01075 [Pseudomonadota bacterium]|nr:hypothetical protein [Pseudomonadota bacterium]